MTVVLPHNHIRVKESRFKLWVDEEIWGHRFYNDQLPWFTMLEFLNVFQSRRSVGAALKEPFSDVLHESFSYGANRLKPIRYLLYSNPFLDQALRHSESNSERWKFWLRETGGNAAGEEFSYLRERFRDDFENLHTVVSFLRACTVDQGSNKRWTSRFLFPYGPDCLYGDATEGFGSNDRRFFARGGELLYLMLNRSGIAPQLEEQISKKLLRTGSIWNRLVKTLLPTDYRHDAEDNRTEGVDIGYLPHPRRNRYDLLAEDWLNTLSITASEEVLFDALVRLSALHMIIYLLEESKAVDPSLTDVRIFLQLPSQQRDHVFELSRANLATNREMTRRALERRISNVTRTPEWSKALNSIEPGRAVREMLSQRFHWNEESSATEPGAILNEMTQDAVRRHGAHLGKVVYEWGRSIGLSLARRGIGTWYAPKDRLLKALVLANVRDKMEYHLFLQLLWQRYRIVIGPQESEVAYGNLPTDRQNLVDNSLRLERRLRALGLLQRLSDDCAYVKNPFGGVQ